MWRHAQQDDDGSGERQQSGETPACLGDEDDVNLAAAGDAGLRGDEAGFAAHKLDQPDAVQRAASLNCGRHKRLLGLHYRRVESETPILEPRRPAVGMPRSGPRQQEDEGARSLLGDDEQKTRVQCAAMSNAA